MWTKETKQQIVTLLAAACGSRQKLFFCLLDLTALSNHILFSSCGEMTFRTEFHLCLVKDMLTHAGRSQKHLVDHHALPPRWADWIEATISTDLSHQIGYAVVCAQHVELSIKLLSSAKSVMWVYVWIKTVFWTITWSQTCNWRRNIHIPSAGEN